MREQAIVLLENRLKNFVLKAQREKRSIQKDDLVAERKQFFIENPQLSEHILHLKVNYDIKVTRKENAHDAWECSCCDIHNLLGLKVEWIENLEIYGC